MVLLAVRIVLCLYLKSRFMHCSHYSMIIDMTKAAPIMTAHKKKKPFIL